MKRQREPHVLVVSSKLDVATDAVVKALARKSARCTRLNTEDLPFSSSITTSLFRDTDTPQLSLVMPDSTAVEVSDVSSLWYRRLRAPERPDDISAGVYDFCIRETMDTLIGSLLVSRAAMMSHPDRIWAAEHKIFQLAAARSLGLRIPETVVTNDPDKVRQAFDRFGGRMVAKAVRTGFVSDEGREIAIYTSLVSEEHLRNLETARWSPTIYQQLIEKACDVRVTVVGEELFVAEIDSQTDDSARIDWRRTTNPTLPHRRGSLPLQVAQALRDLLRRLGLSFGCIDLVRTPSGDYVFLEVNPNGQWLWLDDLLGFGISDEIAAWHVARHLRIHG